MCDCEAGIFFCDRKRLIPGSAGEEHLGFGGAALIVSMAAYRKVCSPFGNFRILGAGFAVMLLCLAGPFSLAAKDDSRAGALPSSDGAASQAPRSSATFLISSSLNLLTGETVSRQALALCKPEVRARR